MCRYALLAHTPITTRRGVWPSAQPLSSTTEITPPICVSLVVLATLSSMPIIALKHACPSVLVSPTQLQSLGSASMLRIVLLITLLITSLSYV